MKRILIHARAKPVAKRVIRTEFGRRRMRITRELFNLICQFAWGGKREYAMTKMLSRRTAPRCSLATVWSSRLFQQVLIFINPSDAYMNNKLWTVNKNCARALKAIIHK